MQIPKELIIYVISMLPIGELRTSIPVAIAVFELNPWVAFLVAVAGTFSVTVLLYYLLDPVTRYLRKHIAFMDRLFEWLFERTRTKHTQKMEELGLLALFIFVTIPLPGSGAWTGTLIAYLFGIKSIHAIPVIGLGVAASGAIVTLGTLGFIPFL